MTYSKRVAIESEYANIVGDWGFECHDGWLEIIEKTLKEIRQYIEHKRYFDFKIIQIKEKFGELRIYTNYTDDRIEKIIDEATAQSLKTCELCGTEGKLRNRNGWLKTLCDLHENFKEPPKTSTAL